MLIGATAALVIEPLHEIGRYGGTLRRAINGPNDIAGVVRFASGPDGFLYWDPLWTTPRPNIARDFELSQAGRVVTLFLRRGMCWSDGAPFTADDVLFWYEDLYLDRRVVPAPSESLRVDGEDVAIRKVDAETVQFVSPRPFPLLVELLASFTDIGGPSFYGRSAMGGFAPRHYLSRFHPKYRSEDAINREAQEAGLLNWAIYLKKRSDCVVHLNPSRDTDLGIRINLSYRRDPEIGDLLGDARLRFRRGLLIGLVSGGFTYRGVHIRKKNLRNVPRRIVNSQVVKSPANGLPMTFYFA